MNCQDLTEIIERLEKTQARDNWADHLIKIASDLQDMAQDAVHDWTVLVRREYDENDAGDHKEVAKSAGYRLMLGTTQAADYVTATRTKMLLDSQQWRGRYTRTVMPWDRAQKLVVEWMENAK